MRSSDRLRESRGFFDRAAPEWARRRLDAARVDSLFAPIGICPGESVVDLGTGTGHMLPVLQRLVGEAGCVCALDLSLEMLRYAVAVKGGRSVLACASAEGLPLASCGWDAVVCMGVFPHFADRRSALREIYRVLKPGGKLAVLHLIGREELNALHQRVGGVIANDLLPGSSVMAECLEAGGFQTIEIAEMPDSYRAVGMRRA